MKIYQLRGFQDSEAEDTRYREVFELAMTPSQLFTTLAAAQAAAQAEIDDLCHELRDNDEKVDAQLRWERTSDGYECRCEELEQSFYIAESEVAELTTLRLISDVRCPVWVHPGTQPRGSRCILRAGHLGKHQIDDDRELIRQARP